MTATATSPIDANLAALGARHAALAARLRATPPHPRVVFETTPDGVDTAIVDGRPLASRHRPLEEARRLAAGIDLESHAVIAVIGFGAGYHVRALVERAAGTALVVVYEPDLALLRAVLERVDHCAWLTRAAVTWVVDDDRTSLATALSGAEVGLVQGTTTLVHPASRDRLGDRAAAFAAHLEDAVTTAKTTMATTLARAVETVRNQLMNLDHYAAGPPLAALEGAAAGAPAVIVSAGPSLARNIDRLAAPGVRERCVIVATQTTLKPLLERGVRPHFVTALDYHAISRRFYECLTEDDVRGVTLVADPKAHPAILEAFPGPVRCCAAPFLDRILGSAARPMGTVPAGATVAHLATSVARFLGCDPVILAGQDLAFTDGLYYAPGNPIHDVWAAELNGFNTIAMMEWQRIARHRAHLVTVPDASGRELLSDAQLTAYLQQFEQMFARDAAAGLTVIDATEGGAAKAHTTAMTLEEALARHAVRRIDVPPAPSARLDPERLRVAASRIAHVRERVIKVGELARETDLLLESMRAAHDAAEPLDAHFERLEPLRARARELGDAFALLESINQLGAYRRAMADRRIALRTEDEPPARQRAEIERDLDNVRWIADAALELADQLGAAAAQVEGAGPRAELTVTARCAHVAALVAVDPSRDGLGRPRSLDAPFRCGQLGCGQLGGDPLLHATLARLGQSRTIGSIALLVPPGFDAERLIDRDRIGVPVHVEPVDGGPFGPEHEAIRAARRWGPTCWRGAVAGLSSGDEALAPRAMHDVMRRRGLTAAVVAGPDWPLVTVAGVGGIDAIVARHLEAPDRYRLVFTQAPPGLGAFLVERELMAELAGRNRLGTIGGLLVLQPHVPQADPVARGANVAVSGVVRRSMVRATADGGAALDALAALDGLAPDDVVRRLSAIETGIDEVVIETTTRRTSRGLFRADRAPAGARPDLAPDDVDRILDRFDDLPLRVTLDGDGDPLLHPEVGAIVERCRARGVLGIHVRTELTAPRDAVAGLAGLGLDVVSVDVNAATPSTYAAMMGHDGLDAVIDAIEVLVAARRPLSGPPGTAAIALPWIVPRLERRRATLDEVGSFFDRWQRLLGTAVIDDGPVEPDVIPAVRPARVAERARRRTAVFRSDLTEVRS